MATSRLMTALDEGTAGLNPAYFALVMATGIVSIAARLEGLNVIAWSLFILNIFFFGILWAITLVRLARNPGNMAADLTSHTRGHGFLTMVAGTCVLGRQFEVVANDPGTAIVLWLIGLALWCAFMYSRFSTV